MASKPERSLPAAGRPLVLDAPQSLTLIADVQHLDAGTHAWRPEGTQDWLLEATLGGAGTVHAGGQWHALRRGQLLLIAPGTPQAYGHDDGAADEWHNIWVHFRPRSSWLAWMRWPALDKGVMRLDCDEDSFEAIEAEMRRMVDVARRPARLSAELAMNGLERVLLMADSLRPDASDRVPDPRIARALDFIADHLAEPLSGEALGRQVGLSRARFSTLFARHVGHPPQVYIESLRLTRAAQLLRSSPWQVGRIAQAVGFDDALYFSNRFRRRYGMPPTTFRQQAASLD